MRTQHVPSYHLLSVSMTWIWGWEATVPNVVVASVCEIYILQLLYTAKTSWRNCDFVYTIIFFNISILRIAARGAIKKSQYINIFRLSRVKDNIPKMSFSL